jgi:hypothetical protein
VEYMLESVLRAGKAAARNPMDEAFAALSLSYAQGDVIDMRATLEAMPVHLVGVRAYAKWLLNEEPKEA